MRFTVSGVGRLTKNPQLEKTANDSNCVKFTVACDNGKDDSVFYWCIAYGKTAEFVAKFFSKGKPIHVSGEWGQYTSEKDNKKHSYIDVLRVDFVPSEPKKSDSAKQAFESSNSEDDDDLPF